MAEVLTRDRVDEVAAADEHIEVAHRKDFRGLDYKWIALGVVLLGTIMTILDATIVNIAVPTLQTDLKAGSPLQYVAKQGKKEVVNINGKVLKAVPGRLLVHTFSFPWSKDKPTRVTYELKPMGRPVRLRLIHENLLPDDIEQDPNTFRGINNGWPAVISSLKSLLETGEPIAYSASC